jgi:DNA-binding GntR family transcriptional regulator
LSATAVGSRQSGPGTIAQHAIEGLRRAFAGGELRPGQRVGQEEIAARLGVSLAPVREALAVLEQEGQLTYIPRRGYFVTELRLEDLTEIYGLRELLEDRAAARALASIDDGALDRLELAARECEAAAGQGDVSAELAANRRFHFGLVESPGQTHAVRLIRLLWDSTETYRALYYNSPLARSESLQAHAQILAAVRARDSERLIAELDAHRTRALERLSGVLAPDSAFAGEET